MSKKELSGVEGRFVVLNEGQQKGNLKPNPTEQRPRIAPAS